MASTPPSNEAFLREVDDELRRDQLHIFWNRWGRWLVGLVVIALGAFAAFLWWQGDQAKRAGVENEKLVAALETLGVGTASDSNQKLATAAASSNQGYRALAKLAQGGLALDKGDTKTAVSIFGSIAADESVPKPFRDLALVRQTAAEFDAMKPDAVIARLKPLAVQGNPWFGSAGEMVAIAYLKMGKPALAGKLFGDMGRNETVPESIRSRAVQMAGVLGVDAVDPSTKGKVQ